MGVGVGVRVGVGVEVGVRKGVVMQACILVMYIYPISCDFRVMKEQLFTKSDNIMHMKAQ